MELMEEKRREEAHTCGERKEGAEEDRGGDDRLKSILRPNGYSPRCRAGLGLLFGKAAEVLFDLGFVFGQESLGG